MWFEALTGFAEDDVADVAAMFEIDGVRAVSKANGRSLQIGRFETPTLDELRNRARGVGRPGRVTVREMIGDSGLLHADPANAGSMFQVASQFNCLEMVSPDVPPERGVTGYEHDLTQGPACAIACGAGTIGRAYLATHDGRTVVAPGPTTAAPGQRTGHQLDLLAGLADAVGVELPVRNGYALPSVDQLDAVADRLTTIGGGGREELMGRLRLGVQWDTEVTAPGAGHAVSQIYCSALPVAYSGHPPDRWEPLARLVLDAAYEATVHAGVLQAEGGSGRTLYLTLLGAGAFGNPIGWVVDAIERAVGLADGTALDVVVVSYRSPEPALTRLL